MKQDCIALALTDKLSGWCDQHFVFVMFLFFCPAFAASD
jgi:hypothetical protein